MTALSSPEHTRIYSIEQRYAFSWVGSVPFRIAGLHCHAIQINSKPINKRSQEFQMLSKINKYQLLQVSGLCGTAFLSYLPKRSTEMYRAQYADAILV